MKFCGTNHRTILVLGFGLLAAVPLSASAQQRLYDIAVPGRHVVDPHNTRADFLLAVLAAQQTARRESDLGKGTGRVTLAPGVNPVFTDKDPQFRLEGFTLLETTINSIAPPKSGGDGQRLFGVMRLTHPSGLGANVGFIVDYLRKGDGIVVNELSALTVTPLKPRVSVLALPAADLARIEQRAAGRFVALFEAMSLIGRPLPLAAADPKAPTTVVVLSADRLLPGDRLEATFTDKSGRPIIGLPPTRASEVGGYIMVAQDFPAGLGPGIVAVTHVTDLHPKATDGRRSVGSSDLVALSASEVAAPTATTPAAKPQPPAAQETWQKVKAFGVELEVPARWKRINIRKPPSDHDESQFVENSRNVAAGAWFSVFPNNEDLIDPDRKEQPIVLDGQPAILTELLTRAEDPPPRRRQITIYLADRRGPAFLFDGDEDKWSILGPILEHIQTSIRLPKK